MPDAISTAILSRVCSVGDSEQGTQSINFRRFPSARLSFKEYVPSLTKTLPSYFKI
jgi:hypothetical protein